jgi:hypothetical protein
MTAADILAARLAEQQRNYVNAYDPSQVSNATAGQADSPWQFDSNGEMFFDQSRVKAPAWSGAQGYGLAGLLSGAPVGNDALQAQGMLERLRQFDPNAQLNTEFVGGGGEGGDSGGQTNYSYQFDQSKLPQLAQGLVNYGSYGANRLFNDQAVYNDPTYGPVTASANIHRVSDTGLADIIGPLLVGAATLGGGLAGLAPGMASAGFTPATSGAFAAGGSGTFGAGVGAGASAFNGSAGQMIQRLLSQGSRLSGLSGGGQQPTMTPQQLLLLRLLAMRNQQGGGG